TGFAPTDKPFAKLPPGPDESLQNDHEELTALLTDHGGPSKVMAADAAGRHSAEPDPGQLVAMDTAAGVEINDAKVVKADIDCSNGVIHVIDTVLLPKE